MNKFSRWPFYTSGAVAEVVRRITTSADTISAIHPDPAVTALEQAFADRIVPGARVLYCNSGTSALHAAYLALGLDAGAEIIVPTMTFRATVTPLLLANLCPVLVDCDAYGQLDPGAVNAAITTRTQAVVVTHLWGHPAQLDALRNIVDQHSLAFVEDCSHAHGTVHASAGPVGAHSDVAVWSLGGYKPVTGGLGGMLATRDSTLYQRALLIGQPKYRMLAEITIPSLRPIASTGLGAHHRGAPLHAVLAADTLSRLDEGIIHRRRHHDALEGLLAQCLPDLTPLPPHAMWAAGAWYRRPYQWIHPNINCNDIVSALNAEGLPVTTMMKPLHFESLFTSPQAEFGLRVQPVLTDCPTADRFFRFGVEWDSRAFYALNKGLHGDIRRRVHGLGLEKGGSGQR